MIKDAVSPKGASQSAMGSFQSITFEPDTNTLIIIGDAAAIEMAGKLVEQFDSNPVPAISSRITSTIQTIIKELDKPPSTTQPTR